MGQKINPIGFRLGIVRGWDSNWYGGKTFSDKLVEDQKIRKYVEARIPKGGIAKVVIERTLKRITLTIHTARPGVVIGKGGNEVDKIKEELNSKLAEFATTVDNLEEVFENREQIEISKYYERMPKPTILAIEEFLEGKVMFRMPDAEEETSSL